MDERTKQIQKEVAQIILQQLGNGFVRMTGSKNFMRGTDDKGDHYLEFSIMPNSSKANLVRVTLNQHDYYDLSFIKKRKAKHSGCYLTETLYKESDIDCDHLTETIGRVTGLAVIMPRIIFT
jgi:hypothetical protein